MTNEKIKCKCGRECENQMVADMSGWRFVETINGIIWICTDCSIENMIDSQSGIFDEPTNEQMNRNIGVAESEQDSNGRVK